MEELASVHWLLEQTKKQFQAFGIANLDHNPINTESTCSKKQIRSTSGKRKRPQESLAVLIYQAMRHFKRRVTVAEISDFISDKFVYYRMRKYWTITGTVRNALSKDDRFQKIGRSAKDNKRGCFWRLSCEPLWEQIICGVAPVVSSENEFRFELQKLSTYHNQATPSSVLDTSEVLHSPTESNSWDEIGDLTHADFEDFELFVKEIDDKHPWDDNAWPTSEWSDWIF